MGAPVAEPHRATGWEHRVGHPRWVLWAAVPLGLLAAVRAVLADTTGLQVFHGVMAAALLVAAVQVLRPGLLVLAADDEGLRLRKVPAGFRRIPWEQVDEVVLPSRWETAVRLRLVGGEVVPLAVPPERAPGLVAIVEARRAGEAGPA